MRLAATSLLSVVLSAQPYQRITFNPTALFAAPPSAAATAGFTTQTFSSYLVAGDVDAAQTYNPGNKWYFANFYGNTPSLSSTVSFLAGYGATLGATGTPCSLSTAGISGMNWRGTAFGGGLYAEIVAYWDHAKVVAANGSGGWPSLWSQSIEHITSSSNVPGFSDHWSGQATGYSHFPEPDIMEDDVWSFSQSNYGATIHDSYGIYGTTCTPGYCGVSNAAGGGSSFVNNLVALPASTNVYHRYGVLWIPATGSTNGTITFYLDGAATSAAVSWTQYIASGVSPPPGAAPWTFGVIDGQHLVLMLGTGNNQPMTVGYVAVWQANAANNLTQ